MLLLILRVWESTDIREVALCRQQQSASILISIRLQFLVQVIMITVSTNCWWSETHHGVKEEISEKGDTTFAYKIATNPEIVKQLKGHLMLVHGDIDNNVHPGNTIRVVNALIRANKRFDMLILPGNVMVSAIWMNISIGEWLISSQNI